MSFKLGSTSIKRLEGVYPPLRSVVEHAISLSRQDFTVLEGLRTVEQQKRNVAKGVSKTMNSYHLPQPDGYAYAVDLVPWIKGQLVWDWPGCYLIALAMDEAATEQGVAENIRWGGVWDKRLIDFGGDAAAYATEVLRYQARHPGPDFLDGPHFEWRKRR